jgi:hypothetical protein
VTQPRAAGRPTTYEDLSKVPDHLVAEKPRVYARELVAHAWIVDPIARALEGLRLESGRWSMISTAADRAGLSVQTTSGSVMSRLSLQKSCLSETVTDRASARRSILDLASAILAIGGAIVILAGAGRSP